MRYYSKTTGCTYLSNVHQGSMPADAIPITEERYLSVIANPPQGKVKTHDSEGLPILIDQPAQPLSASTLCSSVDAAADKARAKVAGDALRAVEYDRARIEAEQFAADNYQGTVPPMIAAWAINGRTPQQAADSILAEAAQYNAALVQLRTVRLNAKEQIRALMTANQVEQAQQLAAHTIASIEAAVAGIGNNA